MSEKIKVGILGYGNLGRGAEMAISQQPDMELVAVFSRRGAVETVNKDVKTLHIDEATDYVNEIDVMILCGGSATDLPDQAPAFARLFTTVDSYDTHALIPEYFEKVDKVSKENNHVNIISRSEEHTSELQSRGHLVCRL